jgi:hypothetical protein
LVSDGGGSTVSDPIAIEVGHRQCRRSRRRSSATYAGNVIWFSGGATDPDDGCCRVS